MIGGPQQTIGPEHTRGTVRGQVILLVELQIYVIATLDTFGSENTLAAKTNPSDLVIEQALFHHTHVSQLQTGRN